LLGPVNEGWWVAMTTLAYERGRVANLHLGLRKKISHLLKTAKRSAAARDPVVRQRLAHV
jgi:hypothetical protein